MSKVVVIGAGASGIIAALQASKNNDVILIDGNDRPGKKILITGNGKCNYWNEDVTSDNYFCNNKNILSNILNYKEEVLDYLYKIGLYPKVKNGYYYPASGLAQSVRQLFETEINRNNITTKYITKVIDIKYTQNHFIIKIDAEEIIADKVILATGSKAAPKTGSDGFGYEIASKFGHKINQVLPALTGLLTNDNNIKEWAGVRCDAKLSLYINNIKELEEAGELQLTETGISGICTFNISSKVSTGLYNNDKIKVHINFVPNINDFKEFIESRNKSLKNRTIEELLESIINYKLLNVILKKSDIKKDFYWDDLSIERKELLIKNIIDFELKINDTNSFDKAQVCTGGISLEEVNEYMESIYQKDLYIIGELLDVDGKCGGFNLAFAFITGYIAGKNI